MSSRAEGESIDNLKLILPAPTHSACLHSTPAINPAHHPHQFNRQPSLAHASLASHDLRATGSEIHSVLDVLEKQASELRAERERVEHEYQIAQRSLARYKAACAQMHNSQAPIISKLPIELLICIFHFVQNTVVASQVCRYWRAIALSCPRLWSSLHVHPSRGSKHLENLLARSLGHTIDVCFCPVPLTIPKPPLLRTLMQQQLSLPPIYTQQYHPDMCLTPHVVSILTPNTARFRSFELHAVVPGTWLTLLPLLARPAPALRTLHVYTTLPHDVAQLTFFANQTPQLRNVQITGAFPFSHHDLLRNLTFLRLESVPGVYRPTTSQLAAILKACPDLVSLSLLDAGPVPDSGAGLRHDEGQCEEISLSSLRALAFRDTDVQAPEVLQAEGGIIWFSQHVHMPMLQALHIMLAPHPLAYTSRAGLPSPYSPLYTNPASPLAAAVKRKTTTVLAVVPSYDRLQELYLWAPHATHSEIEALLRRLPSLRTLEIPMVREPVPTLKLFARGGGGPAPVTPASSSTEIGHGAHGDRSAAATPALEAQFSDGYFGFGASSVPKPEKSDAYGAPPPLLPTDVQPLTKREARLDVENDTPNDDDWLCPKLERIGIPYINDAREEALEEALMDVFRVRDGSIAVGDQGHGKRSEEGKPTPKRMTSLLAPTGRPTYIREAVWDWLGDRASIQTLLPGQGGMDMLFDQISKETT